MLNRILIENYRCYDKHEIDFKLISILVGKNNAGKSTVIESLRLLAIAASKYKTINYQDPPSWTGLPKVKKGFKPSLQGLELSFENIFHKYQDPPATITGVFEGEDRIEIYLGENASIFVVVQDSQGNVVSTKGKSNSLNITSLNILPQLNPLNRREKLLQREYVKQHLNTDLSSIHLRNQFYYFNEYFAKFTEIAQQTWAGLQIRELIGGTFQNEELSLMVQDYDFVSEVGWMGHGLQMWLQIMWFLARVNENETIILDEPDVYMHPDLQRKLIRFLMGKYKQVIIATHSVEIIAEVEPENILIIDKQKRRSNYANKLPAVQKILNSIGSIHNLQLTKLSSARKLLLVEGKDIDLLKRFQKTLYPNSDEPLDAVPKLTIGGWGGWQFAIGSNMLMKNSVDEDILVYCIFDSDYHTDDEIAERVSDAKRLSVELHIWRKKEIENYLLVPSAINRFIKKNSKRSTELTFKDVEKKLDEICEALKVEVQDNYASEYQQRNRKHSIKQCNIYARGKITSLMNAIPGKLVLAQLSDWSNTNFNLSFNAKQIAQELTSSEIDPESKSVMKSLEKVSPFE